jgi:hypothetical protein
MSNPTALCDRDGDLHAHCTPALVDDVVSLAPPSTDGGPHDEVSQVRAPLLAVRRTERAALAQLAAARLSDSIRWSGPAAVLDVALLLGPVLADASMRYVQFRAEHFDVAVATSTLRGVARVRPRLPELVAWVDRHGLHFRWGVGRGGYNWKGVIIPARLQAAVLTVRLRPAPKATEQPRCTPPRRSPVHATSGLRDVSAIP